MFKLRYVLFATLFIVLNSFAYLDSDLFSYDIPSYYHKFNATTNKHTLYNKYVTLYKLYIKALRENWPRESLVTIQEAMMRVKREYLNLPAEAFITSPFAIVYSKPSATSQPIGLVPAGMKLVILETRNEWIKVLFEGQEGWIKKDKATEDYNLINSLPFEFSGYAFVRNTCVLREAPSVSAKELGTALEGAILKVIAVTPDGWFAVEKDGKTYWVYSANLQILDDNVVSYLEDSQLSTTTSQTNSSVSISALISTALSAGLSSANPTTSATALKIRRKEVKSYSTSGRLDIRYEVPTVYQMDRSKYWWKVKVSSKVKKKYYNPKTGRSWHGLSICGPSSLSMILQYYGIHDSMFNIAKNVDYVFYNRAGTPYTGLAKGARKYGLDSKVIKMYSIARKNGTRVTSSFMKKYLAAALKKEHFIIALVDTRWDGHYVVITGIYEKNGTTYVQINNSASGRVEHWTLSKFMRYWKARSYIGVEVWKG